MNVRVLGVLAVSLISTIISVPQTFASQSGNLTPLKTSVVLDTGMSSNQAGGFSVATPDGQFVEIQSNDGKRSWLESMTGKRYALPDTGIKIYDSTPNGDVVTWMPAGAGIVKYVYRPGVGVIKTFPDKGDIFAQATHGAFESTKGNWVTLNSNVPDGDVLVDGWTNVNRRYVPLLNNDWQLAWSPDGVDLAAVVGGGYGSSDNWLVIYNSTSHTRKIAQINPFSLPTLLEPIRGGIKWSPQGTFVGVMTSKGIVVYDTITGAATTIPATASDQWGFSDNQLWILDDQNGSTNIYVYGLIVNLGSVFPLASQTLSWNAVSSNFINFGGRVLVEHDNGMISLLTLNSNKLMVQKFANSSGHPWWYDTQNGCVYYGGSIDQSTQTESVWRVQLPKTVSIVKVVDYENRGYEISSTRVKTVGKQIGTVPKIHGGAAYPTSELPAGTKMFSIPGTSTDIAIAVEMSTGVYQKAYGVTSAH